MKTFTEKQFNIPTLIGLSAKSIEEHLKLYSGYVKNANLVLSKIEEYSKDLESNAYAISETQRRFSFEFDGMRNHEYYFSHFEGGSTALTTNSPFENAIKEEWGSFDTWLAKFKTVAMTRGAGWAMLYYDPISERLLNGWVDEQHLGLLTGLTPILALDMWEHSFVLDYLPSGRKNYLEDFFKNLNWKNVEKNFSDASSK